MTEQEAYINALNGLKNADIRIDDEIRYPSIKAIEKQIPKKDKNDCGRCKACGTYNNFVINKLANPKAHPIIHCWNCGQAIEWNSTEIR